MSLSKFQVVLLAIVAALCGGIAKSQTIGKADLTQFYGKFASKIPGNRDSIDVSHFVEWHLAPAKSSGYGAADKEAERSTDGLWVYFYPGRHKNNSIFQPDNSDWSQPYRGEELWYYLMSDPQGYAEGAQDVLTVWEDVNRDSLRFRCAQIGPYGAGLTSLWIENMLWLPDKSILLYVKSSGADGGEWWGGDMFLRAISLCDFKVFYSSSWSSRNKTKVYFATDDLCNGEHRVLELTNYRTADTLNMLADGFAMRTDSAKVRVIDLWQVAVDSFKIDTTAVLR